MPKLAPSDIQVLLSLPEAMSAYLAASPRACGGDGALFAASDPPGRQLGSGGGTVYLLLEAWRKTADKGLSFWDWLRSGRKLIVHGGGRSRRLPAYAALGKPFLPMPALRRSYGQRLDQTLLDFQLANYRSVLARSPDNYRILIASGDVLLQFDEIAQSEYPDADVLGLGMTVEAEVAQDFGVFFTRHGDPSQISHFLQKPEPDRITSLAAEHDFLVDTGMWLMGEDAVRALFSRCGVSEKALKSPGGETAPESYELYATFGLALGKQPAEKDQVVNALAAAVLTLRRPAFYHLGTNRQLIDSVSALQNRGVSGGLSHPEMFIQNSLFEAPAKRGANSSLWVENSFVRREWDLASSHVITGVPPDNDWKLRLDSGSCLDVAPIIELKGGGWCVRGYGFDDSFAGEIGNAGTAWFGRPAAEWFERRGVTLADAGLDPACDIHEAALFPVLDTTAGVGDFVQWLLARRPEKRPDFSDRWVTSRRLSAAQLNRLVDVAALARQRDELLRQALPAMQANADGGIFYRLDLDATSRLLLDELRTAGHETQADGSTGIQPFGGSAETPPDDPLMRSKDFMLRSLLARKFAARPGPEPGKQALESTAKAYEDQAFSCLRESLVDPVELAVMPVRSVLADQIVWARSPVRLDLGGGWTDTPPYCLQHGGRVMNLAVDLNGQPPIQVFAKVGSKPLLTIRSIDLGVEQVIETYEELDTYATPGSEFALAKAAFALAGLLPRFISRGGSASLAKQLQESFGGGIELSMVAAVPAGSGLGTSSILAATLLGALSELCGLGWTQEALIQRTMALEQMLTTGGGWQDQVGGIYRGVKIAETASGLEQRPAVRWLPEHLFSAQDSANSRILLYYTGITRLAKNILQEIVRGMFLNSSRVLGCLDRIGENADLAVDAVQRGSYEQLASTVRRSWESNQALDSGTNPAQVQQIFETVDDLILSGKLLGAGGGGYLILFAKDTAAGNVIRKRLAAHPPNDRARFVDFSISQLGLQVTRS